MWLHLCLSCQFICSTECFACTTLSSLETFLYKFCPALNLVAPSGSIPYGSKLKGSPLEADRHQKVVLRFMVKETASGSATTLHQAFVRVTHQASNREIIFVAEPDNTKLYKFDMVRPVRGCSGWGGGAVRRQKEKVVNKLGSCSFCYLCGLGYSKYNFIPNYLHNNLIF